MVYKVNWLKYQVVQSLVRVRYMTLVNLLAADQLYRPGRELYEPGSPDHANVLYPEYPTWQDKSTQVARHAIEWLTDETARQALIARLVALRERVAAGGASAAAADYIWRNLLPSTLLDCGNESDNSAIYFAADT